MNLVTRAAAQISGAGLSITDLDRMMDSAYGGSATYTGKLVSQQNALQVGAVWACVSALAGDIATAPFIPYYQLEDGRQPAKDHYLWPLLLQEANPELTAFRFKHLMQCWLCLWGNAYAEIEISGRGQVTALWPWRPDRVSISRDPVSGGLLYSYKNNRNQKFTLPQDRILHLRGLGIDGVTGLSPIEQHKQTLGLSMAITEHGARFFGNGARPLGLLKHPATLGDKAYQRLKEEWSSEHEGLTNAHRIAILEEGLDWKDAGFNQVDAQYLETMQFTLEDIGRMYGVPPHRIGNLLRSTNNNIEHQGLEYVQFTMGPLSENWIQEFCFALLSLRERSSVHIRASFRHLIKGDHAAMGDFINKMIASGVMNADEVRDEFLDMNPQADGVGKRYWKQVNTMPISADTQAPPPNPNQPAITQEPAQPSKPNGLAH